MNRILCPLLRCLSYLLLYPSGEAAEERESVSEWVQSRTDRQAWRTCSDFLEQMRSRSELESRELYSRTFDTAPGTCLNLSYHRWGDEWARREALVRLSRLYDQEGYGCLFRDLPDYLPMLLELLSVCREDTARRILDEYAETVSLLAARLQEQKNPYAPLFQVIVEAFHELQQGKGGLAHA